MNVYTRQLHATATRTPDGVWEVRIEGVGAALTLTHSDFDALFVCPQPSTLMPPPNNPQDSQENNDE
jgi:hypothetical protein